MSVNNEVANDEDKTPKHRQQIEEINDHKHELHVNNNNEMIYLEDTTIKYWQQTEETNEHEHKLTMLLDCGSPSTIVGVENFRQIKRQYTAVIQSGFEYSQSNQSAEFRRRRYSKTSVRGEIRPKIGNFRYSSDICLVLPDLQKYSLDFHGIA